MLTHVFHFISEVELLLNLSCKLESRNGCHSLHASICRLCQLQDLFMKSENRWWRERIYQLNRSRLQPIQRRQNPFRKLLERQQMSSRPSMISSIKFRNVKTTMKTRSYAIRMRIQKTISFSTRTTILKAIRKPTSALQVENKKNLTMYISWMGKWAFASQFQSHHPCHPLHRRRHQHRLLTTSKPCEFPSKTIMLHMEYQFPFWIATVLEPTRPWDKNAYRLSIYICHLPNLRKIIATILWISRTNTLNPRQPLTCVNRLPITARELRRLPPRELLIRDRQLRPSLQQNQRQSTTLPIDSRLTSQQSIRLGLPWIMDIQPHQALPSCSSIPKTFHRSHPPLHLTFPCQDRELLLRVHHHYLSRKEDQAKWKLLWHQPLLQYQWMPNHLWTASSRIWNHRLGLWDFKHCDSCSTTWTFICQPQHQLMTTAAPLQLPLPHLTSHPSSQPWWMGSTIIKSFACSIFWRSGNGFACIASIP